MMKENKMLIWMEMGHRGRFLAIYTVYNRLELVLKSHGMFSEILCCKTKNKLHLSNDSGKFGRNKLYSDKLMYCS